MVADVLELGKDLCSWFLKMDSEKKKMVYVCFVMYVMFLICVFSPNLYVRDDKTENRSVSICL